MGTGAAATTLTLLALCPLANRDLWIDPVVVYKSDEAGVAEAEVNEAAPPRMKHPVTDKRTALVIEAITFGPDGLARLRKCTPWQNEVSSTF